GDGVIGLAVPPGPERCHHAVRVDRIHQPLLRRAHGPDVFHIAAVAGLTVERIVAGFSGKQRVDGCGIEKLQIAVSSTRRTLGHEGSRSELWRKWNTRASQARDVGDAAGWPGWKKTSDGSAWKTIPALRLRR